MRSTRPAPGRTPKQSSWPSSRSPSGYRRNRLGRYSGQSAVPTIRRRFISAISVSVGLRPDFASSRPITHTNSGASGMNFSGFVIAASVRSCAVAPLVLHLTKAAADSRRDEPAVTEKSKSPARCECRIRPVGQQFGRAPGQDYEEIRAVPDDAISTRFAFKPDTGVRGIWRRSEFNSSTRLGRISAWHRASR